jgi:hypothetical protein
MNRYLLDQLSSSPLLLSMHIIAHLLLHLKHTIVMDLHHIILMHLLMHHIIIIVVVVHLMKIHWLISIIALFSRF